MRNVNVAVIDAQPIASNNSAAIDASQLYAASFIGQWSVNDAEGTLKIQASNEFSNSANMKTFVPSSGSWVDVPSATVTITAGTQVAIVPMPTSISYRWLRAVWTRTAGTGTVTVYMNAQGV